MNRRSTDKDGCVNFPIESQQWQNSKEGGMFVKLVVIDPHEFDDAFGVCCGVYVADQLTECLVGDDRRPYPGYTATLEQFNSHEEFIAAIDQEQKNVQEWDEYHYPFINDKDEQSSTSRPYLASIVLGSTGWSGFNAETGKIWTCNYSDLTDQGKTVYDTIQTLYPGCDLHLLTFLDT